MEDEVEDVWVKEPLDHSIPLHQHLRGLDASLRCQICRGLYTNPVSLNTCQHSFCSECIRNSLTEQSTRVRQGGPTCPVCRARLDGFSHEKNYRPNRSLQLVVEAFTAVRAPLHQTLLRSSTSGTAEGSAARAASMAAGEERPRRGTKRSAADAGVTAAPTRHHIQPKRRLIYSAYKKKSLQEICRGEGISATGSEQQLRDRHQRFVVHWNSHADSLEGSTKTERQIVNAFNRRELERERQANLDQNDKAAVEKVFQKAQSGNDGTVTSKFEAKLNQNFKDLVASLKQRRGQENRVQSDKAECGNGESSAVSAASASEGAPDDATPRKNDPSEPDESSPELRNESPQRGIQKSASSPSHQVENRADEKTERNAERDKYSNDDDGVVVLDPPVAVNESHRAEPHVAQTPPRQAAAPLAEKSPREAEPMAKKKSPRSKPETRSAFSWNCPACTFLNEKRNWSTATCEICRTPRPKRGSVR